MNRQFDVLLVVPPCHPYNCLKTGIFGSSCSTRGVWLYVCDVNRLSWWKVMFFDRLPHGVCVPIKSNLRHASSIAPARPAATRVTTRRRRSPPQTPRQLGLVRGRQRVVDTAPFVASAYQRRAVTQVAPSHPENCQRVAVSVCQKLKRRQTNHRHDSQRNVYCVILTVAVITSLHQCQWSVSSEAVHIITNLCFWPCCSAFWWFILYCCLEFVFTAVLLPATDACKCLPYKLVWERRYFTSF